MTNGIVIRKCHTVEESQRCVALQREIWKEAELETQPSALFIVAAHTGGQALGAFDGDRLVGFTLAVAGVQHGVPYLHSHMTGIHPGYRDRGVGRMLKLFQREEALSRGIRLISWTFDPLELRNAHFNLNRLGAICRKYLPNFYGVTTSPLHRGLATDRLLVEWNLDSPRVLAAVAGAPARTPEHSVAIEMSVELGSDRSSTQDPGPQHFGELQSRLRSEFSKYFHRGYAAVALRTGSATPAYLLCPWSDF